MFTKIALSPLILAGGVLLATSSPRHAVADCRVIISEPCPGAGGAPNRVCNDQPATPEGCTGRNFTVYNTDTTTRSAGLGEGGFDRYIVDEYRRQTCTIFYNCKVVERDESGLEAPYCGLDLDTISSSEVPPLRMANFAQGCSDDFGTITAADFSPLGD